MSKTKKRRTQKEKGFSTAKSILPFEKVDKFIYIPDDIIEVVSQYMSIIIKNANHRDVDVKKIIDNAKNMFRDGVRYHDDLWMQHCAASVREILIFVNPEHFHQTYQSIPSPTDPNVESAFKFLAHACTYLSSIVHFRESAKVGNAETLYPNRGYGQKGRNEFLRDEPIFFEKVCIDIIYTLYHLFMYVRSSS